MSSVTSSEASQTDFNRLLDDIEGTWATATPKVLTFSGANRPVVADVGGRWRLMSAALVFPLDVSRGDLNALVESRGMPAVEPLQNHADRFDRQAFERPPEDDTSGDAASRQKLKPTPEVETRWNLDDAIDAHVAIDWSIVPGIDARDAAAWTTRLKAAYGVLANNRGRAYCGFCEQIIDDETQFDHATRHADALDDVVEVMERFEEVED